MEHVVLVVEDEPLIRMDAVAQLEAAGLNVVEFDNATQAARYVQEHGTEVAAVFTDINLKGPMDGITLAELVGQALPSVLLLITSGRFDMRPDGLPETIRFMPKPWVLQDVVDAIQEAVEAHKFGR